jgi:hypothetical protein
MTSKWPRALLLLFSVVVTGSFAGCEPGNPNAAEYFEHTPPGKPPENPNESTSERRSRTLRVGKPTKGVGAGNKAASSRPTSR